MSIKFPATRKEVENRAKADVKSQLTTSNPWLKNSFLGALITGYSGRVYEFYLQLKNALLEMFPDTASGAYLERWGSYVSINRSAATVASGDAVFTGTVGTLITLGTTIASSDGITYTTTADATITTNTTTVTSLSRTGSTATANTSAYHNLATGMTVTMAGAVETAYNGDFTITVTDLDTFTYTVTGSPSTPATGTITATVESINVNVASTTYGSTTNQDSGSQLTLSTPISGIDTTVYIPFSELGNGTDVETDVDYRARVLDRYQNPIALFNVAAIKSQARQRAGVTRVWVSEAGSTTDPMAVTSVTRASSVVTVTTTANHNLESGQYVTLAGANQIDYNVRSKVIVISDTVFAFATTATPTTPATGTITASGSVPNGQVKVYFTRDDDTNNIPTASEVNIVDAAVQEIRPAHVAAGDVIVNGPVAVAANFTFTSLSPNTASMKTAITNNLTSLFREDVDVGVAVQSYAYIAAIWQTVDDTGALVTDFTLSTPTTDIAITEGQIATLGTVTFS
jgi:uncharacterized phage protein gp47/JayE